MKEFYKWTREYAISYKNPHPKFKGVDNYWEKSISFAQNIGSAHRNRVRHSI
jgi:hypothetical protein